MIVRVIGVVLVIVSVRLLMRSLNRLRIERETRRQSR